MEEEKQLNFNVPFLSVRRFSSSSQKNKNENNKKSSSSIHPPYPYYKPELKSGPIRDAGAVPFMWEQTPGTPKDHETNTNTNPTLFVSPEERRLPVVAPKLPPGRVLEIIKQREPPGKKEFREQPKNEVVKVSQIDKLVSSNRRNKLHSSYPDDSNASKLGSMKDGGLTENKGTSDSEGDGDNDAFIDAQDTLSRSESFFFNCSISGVSGLDGPDAKPQSGTFSTDPKTRDFMMGRFLPAAKAMASDTPQYAPRRQAVAAREPPPRQLPRVLNEENTGNLLQITPYAEPKFVEDTSEDESEDDEDDYSEAGDSLSKGCGLFPRLCVRSSACLLNPIPGMKVRSHTPLPSSRQVSTWTRTEKSRLHSRSNNEKKLETAYKHKLITGLQQIDDENKLRHESNELVCWSGSQTTDGSYKNGLSGDGGISPYRNEATQSPFREGAGFLGFPKQDVNLKDTRFDPYMKGSPNEGVTHHRGSGSMSPTVEKTLYIDSGSSDFKDFMDNDSQIVVRSQGMEETSLAELFLKDNNDELNISKKGSLSESKLSDFVSSELNFSTDRSNYDDNMEVHKKGENADDEARFLECSDVPMIGSVEFDKPEPLSAEGSLSLVCFLAPLPPPLPKSPSESWLLRTLPSVSTRNAAQFSRKQALKRFSNDPKWETIVKTSNVNNSNLRFAEGLKKPVIQ
ncbi:hypothetical protein MKX01_004077 [Papaver californicum]|nr:hypothetical protein MKX01_004077 [Papaver californicum]